MGQIKKHLERLNRTNQGFVEWRYMLYKTLADGVPKPL